MVCFCQCWRWFLLDHVCGGTTWLLVKNLYNAKNFPLYSSDLFKKNGSTYNTEAIINSNFNLDKAAYNKSVCTRRADEFFHGRNHLEKTIGISPITAAARRRGGGGAAAVRSTTGNKNPPSVCTRRADEFFHGRNHLEKTIGISPITAAARRRGGGGAAAVRWSRERGGACEYLCDPKWFRDTASRGPTTIVIPKSQFRICPTDHDSIGYPRMKASGESSTTKHRLLHASGLHPIPPPNDPKKMHQFKLPVGYVPQPDLMGLRPLSYDIVRSPRAQPGVTDAAKRQNSSRTTLVERDEIMKGKRLAS
ncbi:oligopeptide transporter 2-like [Dorcoceras hygrometricum]|uniref:Oligopeptide transporter 2-like n=1 Tax=Dorcoceras hygrometricum TaxID=472368 RepID=A0A2Z7A3N1_9LAMI|nr:oligopeptide transporter 2-like [Dorcoceras hygrometricum]